MRPWALIVIVGFAAQSMSAAPHTLDDAEVLYFFFNHHMEDAPEAARRVVKFIKEHRGKVRLRPVLLVTDFPKLGAVDEKDPLFKTLKELRSLGTLDIPLYDTEGLALADHWKIERGPAFVLVHGDRAHRAFGAAADLGELRRCKR